MSHPQNPVVQVLLEHPATFSTRKENSQWTTRTGCACGWYKITIDDPDLAYRSHARHVAALIYEVVDPMGDDVPPAEPSEPTKREFLTTKEFAELACVEPRTIREWIKAGTAPTYSLVNRRYYFEAEVVYAFLRGEQK